MIIKSKSIIICTKKLHHNLSTFLENLKKNILYKIERKLKTENDNNRIVNKQLSI